MHELPFCTGLPPLEALSTGRSDCEDYAIEKYVALLYPGLREEDAKLVIVRNLALNQDHAMVATRVSGEPGKDRLQDRFCPWQSDC
jgi:predicted transglutaminase-like cysteine proteinase